MKFTKTLTSMTFLFVVCESPALAQNIDCSVIKNNPASRQRCEDGQRDARRYEKEREHHKAREERIKDGIRDGAGTVAECVKGAWSCTKRAVKPKKAE